MDPVNTSSFDFRTDNTVLGNYVLQFYKNDYKFLGDNSSNNFTKKKACCMNNEKIGISLPSWDSSTGKVVPTVLQTKVFTDAEWATSWKVGKVGDTTNGVCSFGANGTTGTYHGPIRNGDGSYQLDTKSNRIISNSTCVGVMQDNCLVLGQKRLASYPKPSSGADNLWRYYGPYERKPVSRITNPKLTLNPFTECNCENSKYADSTGPYSITSSAAGAPLDKHGTAQNFDSACYLAAGGSLGDLGKSTWIQTNLKSDSICLNFNYVGGNVTATDDSLVDLRQTCPDASSTPPPPAPTNTPVNRAPTQLVISAGWSIPVKNIYFTIDEPGIAPQYINFSCPTLPVSGRSYQNTGSSYYWEDIPYNTIGGNGRLFYLPDSIKSVLTPGNYIFKVVPFTRYPSSNPEYAVGPETNITIVVPNPPIILVEGTSYRCDTTVNGRQINGFFRAIGGKLQQYPDEPIADSWDANWRNASLIDCSTYTIGPLLTVNPASLVPPITNADLKEGGTYGLSSGGIFRLVNGILRNYNSMPNVVAWEPEWNTKSSTIMTMLPSNTSKLVFGDSLPAPVTLVEGKTYACSVASGGNFYIAFGGKLKQLLNPQIADSWDTNWRNAPEIDCSILTKGAPLAVNPASIPPPTTVPVTTVPVTTVPVTTVPVTTVPVTTVPVTTVPGTTVPGTTVPGTTVPGTTVPGTTVPKTTAPAAGAAVSSEIISGVPNQTFYIGLGVGIFVLLIIIFMMSGGGGGRSRRRYYDD